MNNGPRSPIEMVKRADAAARHLMGITDYYREDQLKNWKQSDPVMHALIKARLKEIRGDAAGPAQEG